MQKKRSLMLIIAASVTTLSIFIFIIGMLGITISNFESEYSEYTSDMMYFALCMFVLFIASILLWLAYILANAPLALAGAIVLSVFLILHVLVFPIPMILSWIGFGMQLSLNKKNSLAQQQENNQSIMF